MQVAVLLILLVQTAYQSWFPSSCVPNEVPILMEYNILISRRKTVSQSSGQLVPVRVRKLLIIMRRVPVLDRIEINNPIKGLSVSKTPSNCYGTIPFKKCNSPEPLIPQQRTLHEKDKR